MVYLYAGLGLLMITGIMAIFEMATSFEAQQMRFRPARSDYSGSSAQQADQDLMRLLAKDDLLLTLGVEGRRLREDALCEQIQCKVNLAAGGCQGANAYDESFKNSPLNSYNISIPTLSNAERLDGSCALAASNHRILIAPNPSQEPAVLERQPYVLYSCQTNEKRSECLFETRE